MNSTSYSWYGFGNQYNVMTLLNEDYYGSSSKPLMTQAATLWGMTLQQLSSVLRVMNYCYSDFLFMGPIETRTV
jgi:hypothetical protein